MSSKELTSRMGAIPLEEFMNKLSEKIRNHKTMKINEDDEERLDVSK